MTVIIAHMTQHTNSLLAHNACLSSLDKVYMCLKRALFSEQIIQFTMHCYGNTIYLLDLDVQYMSYIVLS